jgi:hypothetical protein
MTSFGPLSSPRPETDPHSSPVVLSRPAAPAPRTGDSGSAPEAPQRLPDQPPPQGDRRARLQALSAEAGRLQQADFASTLASEALSEAGALLNRFVETGLPIDAEGDGAAAVQRAGLDLNVYAWRGLLVSADDAGQNTADGRAERARAALDDVERRRGEIESQRARLASELARVNQDVQDELLGGGRGGPRVQPLTPERAADLLRGASPAR